MGMTRNVLGVLGLFLFASSPVVAQTAPPPGGGPSVGAVHKVPPPPNHHAVTPHLPPPGGGNNGGGNNGGGSSGGSDLPNEPGIGGASAAFQPADAFSLPEVGAGIEGPAGVSAGEAAEVRADLTRVVLRESRRIEGALVLVPDLGKGASAPDGSLYAETAPQGPVNQNLFAVVGMGTPSVVANPAPSVGADGESQYAGQEPETAPVKKPGEVPEGATLPVKFKKGK